MKDRLALVVAFVSLGVSLLGNATTLAVAESADAKLCFQAQENRAKIREQIQENDPRKLKEGDPGFEYWSLHPEERDAAGRQIDASLNRFPEIDCEE